MFIISKVITVISDICDPNGRITEGVCGGGVCVWGGRWGGGGGFCGTGVDMGECCDGTGVAMGKCVCGTALKGV